MSTVIIIGAGPRPHATIVVQDREGDIYQINDGDEVIVRNMTLKAADALLPIIQGGQ